MVVGTVPIPCRKVCAREGPLPSVSTTWFVEPSGVTEASAGPGRQVGVCAGLPALVVPTDHEGMGGGRQSLSLDDRVKRWGSPLFVPFWSNTL